MAIKTSARQVLTDLLKRKDEMLAERNKPDPLVEIESVIAKTEAELAQDAATDLAGKLQAARLTLREKQIAMIHVVNALDDALEEEVKAERAVITLGGSRGLVPTFGLYQGLTWYLANMRRADPELMGLPVPPTAEEMRRHEIMGAIESGEKFIKLLEDEKETLRKRHFDSSSLREDADKLIDARRKQIERWRRELAGQPEKAAPVETDDARRLKEFLHPTEVVHFEAELHITGSPGDPVQPGA